MPDQIFKTNLFSEYKKLFDYIDELKGYGFYQIIKFPFLVTIGLQKTGKTSLISNIMGFNFFPQTILCPVQIKMIHLDSNFYQTAKGIQTYAQLDIEKKQKFFDSKKIKQSIQAEFKKAQQGKRNPMSISIYSNLCPNINIIDLPGNNKILTFQQIQKYIRKEQQQQVIFLCVFAANFPQDKIKQTIDIAQKLDPKLQRTIFVISKIDQGNIQLFKKIINSDKIDKNNIYAETYDKLSKNGFVAINNKCLQDNKGNKSHFDTVQFLNKEQQNYYGIQEIKNKITNMIMKSSNIFLSKIMVQIQTQLQKLRGQLFVLGDSLPSNPTQKNNFLMTLINQFSQNFKNTIKGKYQQTDSNVANKEFQGGAKINDHFRKIFWEFCEKEFDCTKEYKDQDIESAINTYQGDQISGFPSMDSFLSLIVPQLQKLKEPIQFTIDQVYKQLLNVTSKINKKIFFRFTQLSTQIALITQRILQQLKQKTKENVENLINAQYNCIFTNDQKYLAIDLQFQDKNRKLDPRNKFINQIRERLKSYYRIVVRALRDNIPKTIGFFLVKQSQSKLQMVIYNEILNKHNVIDSMTEPLEIEKKRIQLRKHIDSLRKTINNIKKQPMQQINYSDFQRLIQRDRNRKIDLQQYMNIKDRFLKMS